MHYQEGGERRVMHNIEYLTERDLKYFEKKEALGEAIIIRITPEALLSMDLDALFQEREKDQTLSAEELEAFFHGSHMKEESDPLPKQAEEHEASGLEKNLQIVSLSEEQKQAFMRAVRSGATDEELMELLQRKDNGS